MVDRCGDADKNTDGDESEQQVNQQANKTPKMVAAGFEERGGGGLGVEYIGCDYAAGGKKHKYREDHRVMKHRGARLFERGIGLTREFSKREKIEAVYEALRGYAVTESPVGALGHPFRSPVRKHQIDDENPPKDSLPAPDTRGAGCECFGPWRQPHAFNSFDIELRYLARITKPKTAKSIHCQKSIYCGACGSRARLREPRNCY